MNRDLYRMRLWYKDSEPFRRFMFKFRWSKVFSNYPLLSTISSSNFVLLVSSSLILRDTREFSSWYLSSYYCSFFFLVDLPPFLGILVIPMHLWFPLHGLLLLQFLLQLWMISLLFHYQTFFNFFHNNFLIWITIFSFWHFIFFNNH